MNATISKTSEAYKLGEKAAKAVSDFVNSCSLSPEGFIETLAHDHPLLQQRELQLFLKWIWAMAEQEVFVQNRGTIMVCRKIKEELGDQGYIPDF